MFKFFDLNKSGFVSKNEFLRTIAKIGVVIPDVEVKNIFLLVFRLLMKFLTFMIKIMVEKLIITLLLI